MLLPCTIGYGQHTEMDTILFKRSIADYAFENDTLFVRGSWHKEHILAGTMFLPGTDKTMNLLNHGLSPIHLEIINDCDEKVDPKTFKEFPKLNSTYRVGNLLTIDVAVIANCCHAFLGEAEVLGLDTLHLSYTSYGMYCSCQCCFTLRYTFDTAMEHYYHTLKYVSINGSEVLGTIAEQELSTKDAIEKIRKIFEDYIQCQESTDSDDNKTALQKSLLSISSLSNAKELELLINIWMYYDPTDFPTRPLVYDVLKKNKVHSIEAVKNRLKHQMEWEDTETAPYVELFSLLQQLEKE